MRKILIKVTNFVGEEREKGQFSLFSFAARLSPCGTRLAVIRGEVGDEAFFVSNYSSSGFL